MFCGGCQLVYEVHASVWWPIIYTNYIQTIIYTVEEGSGSTLGSHTQYVNATALSQIDYGVNFSTYPRSSLLCLFNMFLSPKINFTSKRYKVAMC